MADAESKKVSEDLAKLNLDPSQPACSSSSGEKKSKRRRQKKKKEANQIISPHKVENERLAKKDRLKRAEIYKKFFCPLGEKCKFKEKKCLFLHDAKETTIKHVPEYVCPRSLFGSCVKTPYPRKNMRRKKCKNGWHLTLDELNDLPSFEAKNSSEIKEHSCPVCFEYFPIGQKRAYMVKCSHIFCVSCIKRVMLTKPECPLCRTEGTFLELLDKPTTRQRRNKIKHFNQKKNRRRTRAPAVQLEQVMDAIAMGMIAGAVDPDDDDVDDPYFLMDDFELTDYEGSSYDEPDFLYDYDYNDPDY